ncbi:MAG TPA: hypothetical protein VFC38_08625 [Stellaceae bacterium]|nr:hypothetical protein [Stellaceae bacterium]
METANKPDERQVVCSACFQVVPESLIRILPHFSDDLSGYVALHRCERCWLPALDETRTRITKTEDWAEIASLGAFFELHGVFLLEFRRGDPLPVVRALLGRTIELVRSGAIRLSTGALAPASKVEVPASEMKMNEELAEAAYGAMYQANSSLVKDCFDDARGYFTKAIDMAKRAGLEDEVARLTARRDHIVSVYNTQFRGIR